MLKRALFPVLLCSVLGLASPSSYADLTQVPLPDNFDVRMKLDDEYPMILTGYVKSTAEGVMQFYFAQLGDPINMVEDIGRQTLFYKQSSQSIKISVYQQSDWTEVNVMVTQ
ncbi:hypothetical protein PULV_a1046 [Pseudoalteromonas ulvae UL12]|uniref:Uncharacterized protein n=1 Tax=Pseudoalteromonas ulvae TaxID=107327 RepID=A0A244CS57_PSEDV|nr:hypothetical protein [Pseudoalteromonas ulvae]MBE0363583.1 hypothetical protein [Pseudoalteromonas ulvae UL12]OUL58447.1 hypothetical protein B1199_08960 [Pseudoalteromonas ulvae]